MEHLKGILSHMFGSANKQYTYQLINTHKVAKDRQKKYRLMFLKWK